MFFLKEQQTACTRHWTEAVNRMAVINSHYSFYCSKHIHIHFKNKKKRSIGKTMVERVNLTIACQPMPAYLCVFCVYIY